MTDQVETLLAEAARLPYGEARTVLAERALREAEALREPEPAIAARLALTQAYQYGGEPAKSFATFSRTVAAYDAEPGRFTEWQARRVLWQFKWIMSDMRRFPEIPLRRTLDALDDMERRYREAGAPQAVYAQRCRVALHLGDEPAVEEWLHRWETTPRDDLSDCRACDLGGRAYALASLGRYEEAVAVGGPVVAGEFSCGVQPQSVLCTLLTPYLKTGHLDEAAEAHRRAYRIVQGQIGYLDDIGDHLEFCALTGNETRGLEILERELPLLERPPSPAQARSFMTGAALVLRRLMETGHDGLTVRRAGRDVPMPELHEELAAGAREIAARFDVRNGDDVHTRRLAATLAAEPLVAHLPFVSPARRGEPDGRIDTDSRTAVRALFELGEHEAGLAALREAGDPAAAMEAAKELADLDLDVGAAQAYAAAADLYRDAGELLAAGCAMRLRAKCVYFASDDLAEISEAYAQARAALTAASDMGQPDAGQRREAAWELAGLGYDEAVALEWAKCYEAAAERCQEALDTYLALDDQIAAVRARELLEGLREETEQEG
ncbi:hypothetical protein [Nonomuraea aurantiaca]|uniref:hypothetical protein n=1 Tax=Nonomuraea aurantiaca TaxID=2878562 RepID=UPI001CD9A756|nr:hypothetical protein [Nonomuraea aurantiaca]MCA2222383.1 hypothetical protein [Nonomuraea aurantiaca]